MSSTAVIPLCVSTRNGSVMATLIAQTTVMRGIARVPYLMVKGISARTPTSRVPLEMSVSTKLGHVMATRIVLMAVMKETIVS